MGWCPNVGQNEPSSRSMAVGPVAAPKFSGSRPRARMATSWPIAMAALSHCGCTAMEDTLTTSPCAASKSELAKISVWYVPTYRSSSGAGTTQCAAVSTVRLVMSVPPQNPMFCADE